MTARMRLLGGAALAVGVWSVWIVYSPNEGAGADAGRRARTAQRSAPALASREDGRDPAQALPTRSALAVVATRNPFEAKPWVAKREAPKVAAVAAPVVVVPPAPPPPPPLQLPYKFLGMYTEKSGSPSVFLSLGERLIVAKSGDAVEGGFRLQTVSPRELTFVHVQQNVTLRMSVDGGPL
jgi:hypothetical protein